MMRFLFAASVALTVVALIAGALLFPSHLILERSRSSFGSDIASSSPSGNNTSDRALITHIQSRISDLAPLVVSTSTPSDAILAALALRPSGVSVDHITYSKTKTATILLSGSSKTGDRVNAYQGALAANALFSGVSVPVGALAGVDNGHFSITLIGAF